MPEIKGPYENNFQADLIPALERIAVAQEQLLAIALEARDERMKLSNKMKEAMQAGFRSDVK